MYRKYGKRIGDILFSLVAMVLLSPVFIGVAVGIRLSIGKPVLFRQQRVGKDGLIFTMVKFRTLTMEIDTAEKLLPDPQRQTKLGRFLRSTGLDELPELWNILKGDLSIIGPRPLLVEYLAYYTPEERHRHDVRGGLIPPEVLYNDIMPTWENQFFYEIEYTKKVCFLLDIKIFFAVIKGLFSRKSKKYGEYTRETFIHYRENQSVLKNDGYSQGEET